MTQTIYILRRNSGKGGAEKAAERLASCLEPYYRVERLWAGNTFRNKTIPGKSGPPWWRSWRYTRFIDSLKLKCKDQLILSLEYGPECDIYRAGDGVHIVNRKLRFGTSKRWMLNPWHWYAPKLENKCLESAVLIAANSKMVEAQIIKEYPHLREKVITIYNGYNPSIFKTIELPKYELRRELGLPAKGIMLLLSGNGYERKGLSHAIRLLAELVNNLHKDAYLVVAGRGNRQIVDDDIRSFRLEQRVHFVGSINRIEQFYQAADFMVLPTRNDPFSNSCLEALACGCPVITSNRNGAAEIISPGCGWIMDSGFSDQEIVNAADFVNNFDGSPEVTANSVQHLTEMEEAASYLHHVQQLLIKRNANQPLANSVYSTST